MTYFRQALSAPELHFKRLRQMEPISYDGQPNVTRTHHTIETEILWNGHRYLLSLPFSPTTISHIEKLEEISRERTLGPLIPNIILYDELTLLDSLGTRHTYDIILQQIPYGKPLCEALLTFRANEIRTAVIKMKERMDSLGFCHNNLRPYNIIICNNGTARPLRYWYAHWEVFSDNDISALLDIIDQNGHDEGHSYLDLQICNDTSADYEAPISYRSIRRECRCGRYGFIDEDGSIIAPFIYSWASHFQEGRAVVAKNHKMGAIDNRGKKIIPVIYHSLEFDISTGSFTATRDNYHYLLDYDGKLIRRTPISEDDSNENGATSEKVGAEQR